MNFNNYNVDDNFYKDQFKKTQDHKKAWEHEKVGILKNLETQLSDSTNLDPEIGELVNRNFWDLF